jgi:hypothetical protein
MRPMTHETPELIDRTEVRNLRDRWDGARTAWPDEAWSEWWHVVVPLTVDARVLLCMRVRTATGWRIDWAWAAVCSVRRFRVVVEMLQPVAGTSLLRGHRFSIDPVDHAHVTLIGAKEHAEHSAWLRQFQSTGPQPPQRKESSHVDVH